MAQAAYWFKHDTNAKDDYKCMLLIDQLGLEGYGIFWVLIETLREQEEYRYPMAMLPILAKRYGTSGEKMKTVVTKYGLFEVFEDDTFSSPALVKRMGDYDLLCLKRKEIGAAGGRKKAENRQESKVLVLPPPMDPEPETLSTNDIAIGKQDPAKPLASDYQSPTNPLPNGKQDLTKPIANDYQSSTNDVAIGKQEATNSLPIGKQMVSKSLPNDYQTSTKDLPNRRELNREELRRDDETGREGSVRGGLEGRSDLEEYRKVRIHSVSVAVVRSFLKDGYSLPEIDDVLDGLELYSGIDQVRSIGGLISSWLKKRRSSPRKTPGSTEYDPRYRLFTPKEVDRAGIWKEVSIVRIEGMSACRSAKGKVLMAFDTDIEKFGLCRREPKQHGQDWPD